MRLPKEGHDITEIQKQAGEGGKDTILLHAESQLQSIQSNMQQYYKHSYEGVLDQASSQEDVFEAVKASVHATLDGDDATILAYGQTGSGKTYTMFGDPHQGSSPYEFDEAGQRSNGIIPRSIEYLFEQVQGRKEESEESTQRFSISCSCLQVYNEKLYDLLLLEEKTSSLPNILSSRGAALASYRQQNLQPLHIREDINSGVTYVEGLSQFPVQSARECLAYLARGDRNRATRETKSNMTSSRSHTIFQVCIDSLVASKKDGS